MIESTGKDEVRKDLDELKIKTKEETEALKDKIDAVDSSGKKRIQEVDEKTCVVQTQVKSFSKFTPVLYPEILDHFSHLPQFCKTKA